MGQPYRGKLPPSFQLSDDDNDIEVREDDRGRFVAVYPTVLYPKVAASQVKNRVFTLRCTESEAAMINMGWEIARSKGSYGKKASKSDMLRFAALMAAKINAEEDETGVLAVNSVLARFQLEQQIEQDEWEEEAILIMEKSLDNSIASDNPDKFNKAMEAARVIFRECTSIPIQNKMLKIIERAEDRWDRR